MPTRGARAGPAPRPAGRSLSSTARGADPDLGSGPGHLHLDLAVFVLEAGHALVGQAVLGPELAREGVQRVPRAHGGKDDVAPPARGVREVPERVVVVGPAHLALAPAGLRAALLDLGREHGGAARAHEIDHLLLAVVLEPDARARHDDDRGARRFLRL